METIVQLVIATIVVGLIACLWFLYELRTHQRMRHQDLAIVLGNMIADLGEIKIFLLRLDIFRQALKDVASGPPLDLGPAAEKTRTDIQRFFEEVSKCAWEEMGAQSKVFTELAERRLKLQEMQLTELKRMAAQIK